MVSLSLRTAILVAVLSLVLRRWKHQILPNEPCSDQDEPVRIGQNITLELEVHPCSVFSETYERARYRFRQAVKDLQKLPDIGSRVVLDSLPIVKERTSSYTIDIAVVQGNAPGLVIHSSGVHGIEGFAGSAVQLAFLQLLHHSYSQQGAPAAATENDASVWKHPTLVLVHAVNPYGMAHYRRTNEHNVDLNRNGLTPEEWKTFATNHYNRANYDRFDQSFFNPSRPPTWCSSWFELLLKCAWTVARHGMSSMKTAMVGAQYHVSTGIFYGGKDKVEPSLLQLRDWLEDYLLRNRSQLQEQEESDSSALVNAVTWVDLHTGLGKMGVDTLLMVNGDETKSEDTARELDQWFPGADHPYKGSAHAASVIQGYENVKGTVNDYFRPLFSPSEEPVIVTQEFGTVPSILVARALVAENAAYHYSPKDQALDWAERTTKPAFYPQSLSWRRQILQRGVHLLIQAMERSKSLSASSQ